MRKHPLNFYALWLFLVSLISFSCEKQNQPGDYSESKPSSIYNLRRVQLDDNLRFGKTAMAAVVTSDIDGGNLNGGLLIVQDPNAEAAISIELTEIPSGLKPYDQVTIDLNGSKLIEKNGELILTNLPASQIVPDGKQKVISPKVVTISGLLANAGYWGPILVRIDKVTIKEDAHPKLSGNITIDDEIAEMTASFLPQSVFTDMENPGYLESLVGLPIHHAGTLNLFPRNSDDLQIGLMELLEDFEQSSNTNYDSKVMSFVTGEWTIDGGITATSTADLKNGKQSIRLQGTIGNPKRNGIIAMNFDLKGVKSVSVSHGIYPAAAEMANVNPTVFTLEISKDGGASYQEVGTAEIDVQSTSLKTNTFSISAGKTEEVRFRVVNTSLPFTNNNRPRINIDDIHFKF